MFSTSVCISNGVVSEPTLLEGILNFYFFTCQRVFLITGSVKINERLCFTASRL